MISVPLPAAELAPLLDERLSIAAINRAADTGEGRPAFDAGFVSRLRRSDRGAAHAARRCAASTARPASMSAPGAPRATSRRSRSSRRSRKQLYSAPAMPFVSNVTGTWLADAERPTRRTGCDSCEHTVRFVEGLARCSGAGARFVEVGPGPRARRVRAAASAPRRAARRRAELRHPAEKIDDATFFAGGGRQALGRRGAGGLGGGARGRTPLSGAAADVSVRARILATGSRRRGRCRCAHDEGDRARERGACRSRRSRRQRRRTPPRPSGRRPAQRSYRRPSVTRCCSRSCAASCRS